MSRVRGHYGVVPNNPNRPRVRLRHKPGALNPPASVDYYSQVPAASWGMLANGPDNTIPGLPNFQGCGDCTVAGASHIIDQVAWFAQGNMPAPITSAEALTAYEAISGYNPSTGANDNGAELQQVLQWWTQNGLGGYVPSGYAQIDVTNIPLVQQCIADFGAIYTGFAVPAIFETQFDAGQPWDVPTSRAGRQILGGHCVPIIGFDAKYLYCVTWGAVQKITYAAFAKYWGTAEGGEAWVAVLPQSVEATGATFEGLDVATANADFQSLTGSTESPFPSVGPTPPVPPTPPTPPTPPAPPTPSGDPVALLQSIQSQIAAFLAANPPHVHGH